MNIPKSETRTYHLKYVKLLHEKAEELFAKAEEDASARLESYKCPRLQNICSLFIFAKNATL